MLNQTPLLLFYFTSKRANRWKIERIGWQLAIWHRRNDVFPAWRITFFFFFCAPHPHEDMTKRNFHWNKKQMIIINFIKQETVHMLVKGKKPQFYRKSSKRSTSKGTLNTIQKKIDHNMLPSIYLAVNSTTALEANGWIGFFFLYHSDNSWPLN